MQGTNSSALEWNKFQYLAAFSFTFILIYVYIERAREGGCGYPLPSLFCGHSERRANLSMKGDQTIAFITAVFGYYEKSLKEPAIQDKETSFIAFTDRNDLNKSESVCKQH